MVAALTDSSRSRTSAVELQVSVALHRLDQRWCNRLQPLPADPIRGLPQHHQGLAYRFAIHTPARPGLVRRRLPIWTAQLPHGMFAMTLRHRHEFVENLALLTTTRFPISLPKRLQEFQPRLRADASAIPHLPRSR